MMNETFSKFRGRVPCLCGLPYPPHLEARGLLLRFKFVPPWGNTVD